MFKNYTLSLLLLCFAFYFGYGQVTIAIQDFESIPATPTLNYSFNVGTFNSVSGNSGGGSRPANSPQFTSANTSWRIRDVTIDADFGPTNITGFESVNVEFNLAGFSINSTNGLDAGDYLDVYISLDNGNTWSYELEITGDNNARWAFNSGTTRTITYDGDNNPLSYSSSTLDPIDNVIINIPDADAAIASNFLVGFVISNDNTNESWNIDDIKIEGVPSTTSTFVEFTSTSSSLDEDGLFIDLCASITNPSASNATSVDIVLDPSSTATNGSDFDDGASTPGPIAFPLTLTFPAGSSADQCFTIYISNDDLLVEGDETVVLNLTNPNGGDAAVIGSNNQHILTIVDNEAPVIANVVITEIMYNTSGIDDEWIEICNVSGSAQVLNNYTIEYNGNPAFTFPSTGAVIADGDCITVSLGSDGDGTYNIDCPFTPDYGIDASTNNTNNLVNSSATITVVADDGATVIDSVTYNSADGANGNGSSLHVIDDALDNSDTDTNWQEVGVGGSPGTNNLISPCAAVEPDINVEGDLGSFPNISNNDVTPSFLDNTRFASQLLGNSQTKSFRIQNIGTLDLNVSNIQIIGGGGDFTLTLPSTLPITIAPNNLIVFEVTFAPSVAGTRDAIVRITSNDPDDNPFQYAISGIGICSASSNVIAPTSGPDNTIVSITGNDLNGSTTVEFGGSIIPHTVISSTEIQVEIPVNSETGNITVTNNLGCVSTNLFTIIYSAISSCEGNSGPSPSDLFISQVTDSNSGSLSYIEIYNGTGSPVNLNGYSIQFFNNGSNLQNGGFIALNNVTLNSGDTYTVRTNVGASCSGVPGANGSFADQISTNGGINFGSNSDDHIRLYNGSTHIDSWGEYLSAVWADPLGIGSEGVTFSRNSTATTLPNTTFDVSDWSYINWSSCSENDYSDIGTFDFSTGTPPTVNSISNTTTACNEVTITVSATEGFVGGNELRYTWYAFNPAQAGLGWQSITTGGIYSTVNTSPDLIISDAASVLDYQFYCEVRENDASCYTASNAIKITLANATWNGTTWLWNDGTPPGTLPNSATNVVLDGNFDTSGPGLQDSFEACNLIINPGFDLTVADGTYVEVEHDVSVENNASILVDSQGAFIQRGIGLNAGSFTLNGTATSQVNKHTAPLANWYNYTYWSSPVANAVINDALGFANPNRRFWHNASLYLDTNNDDIDDDDNDWVLAIGTDQMLIGRGYAATHSNVGFTPGNAYQYNFEGALNTGDYDYPLSYNAANNDHWNLVGNPYPSAIKVRGAGGLFDANAGVIKTAVYLWSHSSPPLSTNDGNQVLNFNTSDYATINATMSTAGASGIEPEDYIPSGQSFFVSSLGNTNIEFNNDMRVSGDNSNMLFFRNAPSNATSENDNVSDEARLWLNLTSDDGIFSQIGIGYVQNATDSFDGLGYDARRNLSSGNAAIIYSQIEGEVHKLAIQGKAINSLNYEEIIPIGLSSTINENKMYKFLLYKFEGDFLSNNPIYIIDKDLNTIHNLKESDYSFTSQPGEFNNRFEIVFTPNALSIKDNQLSANDLIIRELSNGEVELTINEQFSITKVDILDVLGRQIYKLTGASSREVYNLSKLSKAAYIAKVTLSNGQIITKKAIKQR